MQARTNSQEPPAAFPVVLTASASDKGIDDAHADIRKQHAVARWNQSHSDMKVNLSAMVPKFLRAFQALFVYDNDIYRFERLATLLGLAFC